MSNLQRFNVAFTVPANNTGLHYTVLYLTGLTREEIDFAKKSYHSAVAAWVPNDSNGRPMLGYHTRRSWGQNSDILEGEIAEFKIKLHNWMNDLFPGRVSYRDSHVNVNGNHREILYPSFNMRQMTASAILCK